MIERNTANGKPLLSLFDEPADGPFCEEQEVKAIRPELSDPILTYVPEAIPAVPDPSAMPAAPERDCGCAKESSPVPEPAMPAALAPEAPLPSDSSYIYVENEFGELAAMWLDEKPVAVTAAAEEATAADTTPLPAESKAEEIPSATENKPEADAEPQPAQKEAPDEGAGPEAPPSAEPEPQPHAESAEREVFVSPFKAVEYPEVKPQFRAEPKPDAMPEPKPKPAVGTAKPREVWHMS